MPAPIGSQVGFQSDLCDSTNGRQTLHNRRLSAQISSILWVALLLTGLLFILLSLSAHHHRLSELHHKGRYLRTVLLQASSESDSRVVGGIHKQHVLRSEAWKQGQRMGTNVKGMGILARRLWTAYDKSLNEKPLFTKILTGVVGTIIGDGVAQYSQYVLTTPKDKKQGKWNAKSGKPYPDTGFKYDVPRLMRLLTWTIVAGTPIGHFWFDFLDTRIMPHAPTSPKAVVTKLLMDQLIMAPIGTTLFFMAMKVLEGNPHLAVSEVRSKFWPVMLTNWAVWPIANLINFAYIPPSQRILYVNVLAIAWTSFMSYTVNKPSGPSVEASIKQHQSGITMRHLEPSSPITTDTRSVSLRHTATSHGTEKI